jgi:hypothetical protein
MSTKTGTITSWHAPWWQRLTRRSWTRDALPLLEGVSGDLLAIRTAADDRDAVLSDLLAVMEDIRDDIRAIRNHVETKED